MQDSTSKFNDALPVNDRLQQFRAIRDQMIACLKEKIAKLREERDAMAMQYEEEIASLEIELSAFGDNLVREQPNTPSIKAYNYLLENVGVKFQAGFLMKAIRCEGAVAAIVLAPYLQNGKVQYEGESRGRRYWIDRDES